MGTGDYAIYRATISLSLLKLLSGTLKKITTTTNPCNTGKPMKSQLCLCTSSESLSIFESLRRLGGSSVMRRRGHRTNTHPSYKLGTVK